MSELILTRDKNTGLYAQYPESHLEIFKNLEQVDHEEPCTDCTFIPSEVEVVELTEPAPRAKGTKK